MERISRWIDAFNTRVAQVACWLLLAVVLIASFNTLARWAGRSLGRDLSSNAYIELQWYLFGCIFLLGGAYTLQRNAHVRVDVVYDRLPKRARGWIDLVGHALLLLPFAALGVITAWEPVTDSWARLEGSPDPDGLPRYPIKTVIPLGFALLFLQGVSQLLKQWSALRGGEGAVWKTADGVPAPKDEEGGAAVAPARRVAEAQSAGEADEGGADLAEGEGDAGHGRGHQDAGRDGEGEETS